MFSTAHGLPLLDMWNSVGTWHVVRYSTTLFFLHLIYSFVHALYLSPLARFPGPKLNAITNAPLVFHAIKGDELAYFTKLHTRYGSVVRVAPRELSFIGGSQAWEDIYGSKSEVSNRKDMQFYPKPLNGVTGVLLADNANHSRQRKILNHSFSGKALKQQESLLMYWAHMFKCRLDFSVNVNEPVDIMKLYNCATFDIMGDLTFSENLGMLNEGELSPWVVNIFNGIKGGAIRQAIRNFPLGNYVVETLLYSNRTIRRHAAEHYAYTSDRVNRRLDRKPEHPDLWSKILQKEGEDGIHLHKDEHITNAATFMMAGTETIATALSGATFFLLQNPAYRTKLTYEIRTAFTTIDTFTFARLSRLPYLHAVLQESLRLYPPVPIGLPRRTPPEGALINGYSVPGDVAVAVHQYATYRSAQHFFRPNEFRPERWLGDDSFAQDHLAVVQPFSVGPRSCLGKELAWHEMRVLLAAVLLNYDLAWGDAVDAPRWMARQESFVLWAKRPLMCRLTPALRE